MRVCCAWEQGMSPLSMPSGVAVWTLGVAQHECLSPRVFTFAISAWMWYWSREQTSNSAWNSANLEQRLSKWYDVRVETRPWVVRGVLSGTRALRGRTSLENDERSGRPSTSSTPKNVETIRWLVHEDRRRTIKDIATIVNVSYRTMQTILMCDLNTHHVAICRALSACRGWPILHVKGHHWGRELGLRVWSRD